MGLDAKAKYDFLLVGDLPVKGSFHTVISGSVWGGV